LTPYSRVEGYQLRPEDGSNMVIRKVRMLPHYYARRHDLSRLEFHHL